MLLLLQFFFFSLKVSPLITIVIPIKQEIIRKPKEQKKAVVPPCKFT